MVNNLFMEKYDLKKEWSKKVIDLENYYDSRLPYRQAMDNIQYELRDTFFDTIADLMEEYNTEEITDEQFIVSMTLLIQSLVEAEIYADVEHELISSIRRIPLEDVKDNFDNLIMNFHLKSDDEDQVRCEFRDCVRELIENHNLGLITNKQFIVTVQLCFDSIA